jgi:hypothetical protein
MKKDNLEQLVEELRAVIPFKGTTSNGDIVLVIAKEPKMLLYGMVTSIERDVSKKDEWWNIGLTFFTVPLQRVVWTLRTEQMTGQEIFTMGGEERFFQAIEVVETNNDRQAVSDKSSRPPKTRIKRIK